MMPTVQSVISVTTQAREGIETLLMQLLLKEQPVTTQAREGIETPKANTLHSLQLRNNSSP